LQSPAEEFFIINKLPRS